MTFVQNLSHFYVRLRILLGDNENFHSIYQNNNFLLIGLFEESHLPFETDKTAKSTAPTLTEMTLKAINMLKKGDKGFFLLVSFIFH